MTNSSSFSQASISETLANLGVLRLKPVSKFRVQFEQWIEENNSKYMVKLEQGRQPNDVLLGLLTHSHLQLFSNIEANKATTESLREIMDETLGSTHASKFVETSESSLILVTHLWLYFQGLMEMDYSLANDYAIQTLEALPCSGDNTQELQRREFLESYYLGRDYAVNTSARPSNKLSLLSKLGRWMNGR